MVSPDIDLPSGLALSSAASAVGAKASTAALSLQGKPLALVLDPLTPALAVNADSEAAFLSNPNPELWLDG